MSSITTQTLDCGLTLITERIEGVASAAFNWLLPVGAASDPADRDGVAVMLSEMLFRGAGELSSREHSDALDRLGVDRTSNVGAQHMSLSGAMLGQKMADALPLITLMVREPLLPDDALDAIRSLCLQSLASLEDEPQRLVMLRLRERHMPPPFNRHGYGHEQVLETATIDELRDAWKARCTPGGSILAVAGSIEHDAIAMQLNELLGNWSGEHDEPKETAQPARGVTHIKQDSSQVHIALAYDAPPEPHHDSMIERLGIGVLSGSTSARLFTEVRQKRSLCYSVGASYRSGRDFGYVSMYAGTTPDRAQETLDVSCGEIKRLAQGAEKDEFSRAVVGLKSHLIMQGESTQARAGALAQDQYRLGRPRSLDEIAQAVDAICLDQLNAYLAKRDIGEFTIVTIGPEALS